MNFGETMKSTIFVLIFLAYTILLSAQVIEWQWAIQAGGISYDRI
jgi:hypothetical protein